ncbi:hydroxysqualene dehydroxylase HpnE [Skermanella rosea]|uniref:hydroxysqualene dehydroxylase HpnE n=1 Tax=Skermanella rosea TaxID=1817965 RepID=UPI001931DA3F|nr:hydroxysqualene dehydroxylase HpnE [Skermanella rosea]UEM01446.1 hydroxysqualene dehydroxylase HpnE [Skermanella rosea]
MTTVHVVGAGMAGLAAAVSLVGDRGGNGRRVILYEAAGQAGGRCRSLHDPVLDRTIDNGNHLLLGGNRAVFALLDRIGARDRLVAAADPAEFPFLDLGTGDRWALRPNGGPLPWWMLVPGRRVPGTRLRDYLALLKLLRAGRDATVADCLDPGSVLYRRLWEPLAVAALNIAPERGSARLMGAVVAETFLRGGAACRPFIAARGLSDTFVDPALAYLEARGGDLRLKARLRRLVTEDGRVTALEFAGETVELRPGDAVVLALPPAGAAELLPGLAVPEAHTAILNAHYRLDRPAVLPGGRIFLGLIGGTAEWLFARDDVVSVTVSAADRLIDRPADDLAALLWRDVASACGFGPAMPPARIIKEKRATFRQTPADSERRPGPLTDLSNLSLAGDWTATGLPATIEGAIRSGNKAAAAVLDSGSVERPARTAMQASQRRPLDISQRA